MNGVGQHNMYFKKSLLVQSMSRIFHTNHINKWLCVSVFFGLCSAQTWAETAPAHQTESLQPTTQHATQKNSGKLAEKVLTDTQNNVITTEQKLKPSDENFADSLALLKQQEREHDAQIAQNSLLSEQDLARLQQLESESQKNTASSADQSLLNEILQSADHEIAKSDWNNQLANEAEQAKQNAVQFSQSHQSLANIPSEVPQNVAILADIPPVEVNAQQIQQDLLETNATIQQQQQLATQQANDNVTLSTLPSNESAQQKGLFKRWMERIRPSKTPIGLEVEYIQVEVKGAPAELAQNIKAKLSTFTVESLQGFTRNDPQLTTMANEAAQAMGYYQAQFVISPREAEKKVVVVVTPGSPVLIHQQDMTFIGQGENLSQFRVLSILPEQAEGDIFHHGKYETMKAKISEAASNNGFFDAQWVKHDVAVKIPENEADVQFEYDTQTRYKIKPVEYRMSDPSKPLPIDEDVLDKLAQWNQDVIEGDLKSYSDYAFWRVNLLANNLTNTRYFNYTLVNTLRPEMEEDRLLEQQQKKSVEEIEVAQNLVNEADFAGGVKESSEQDNQNAFRMQQEEQKTEDERLKEEAKQSKIVPVIVTLNADKLNSLETGIGYGTDTGVRMRNQYRRSIVNRRGHSFDTNLELSQIRQSIDGRYMIPYNHPLNDYIGLVGGYEREERKDVFDNGAGLMVESAVFGADRVIKKSRGSWQHTFGLRYRLDRLTQKGEVDYSDIPDNFLVPGADPEQQSLLFGYEISKVSSDDRVNPKQGLKQSYKIEVGSDSLLSDVNLAILNAGWKGLYSLGEKDQHQLVGRADLGYIFTENFDKVPYNLRYFAGGDQTLRGFDYKSLSPNVYDINIGGQGLAVGSLEYNYEFKSGWRAAVFSDFGNAYNEKFSNPIEYSAGVGIRWRSPVGPIRLDVATGLSDDGHPIRLHFFIGPQL